MRLESFVGLRFLRSPRQDRSVALITWLSMGGVTLGVTALIITISVMNGFRQNLVRAVTSTVPHVQVTAPEGTLGPQQRELTAQRLRQAGAVQAVAPYVSRQAFIDAGGEFRAVVLRGIDPAREGAVTGLGDFVVQGVRPDGATGEGDSGASAGDPLAALTWPPPEGERAGILVGTPLARSLGLVPGDIVRVVSTQQRITPVGPVPLMKEFRVAGLFETGISGRDDLLAYVDYRIAQRLYRLGDGVDGLAARMADPRNIDAAVLRAAVPEHEVTVWSEENRNLFHVMKLEKIGLFVILTLIILVAFFNIIASLVMLVLEKRKGIAILKSMGATDGLVRRIFFMQGVWIGAIGTVGGLALGLAGCWALATFDVVRLPKGVFPLSTSLPVAVDPMDLLLITAASFVICMLVTLYPATRAARLRPVSVLRQG